MDDVVSREDENVFPEPPRDPREAGRGLPAVYRINPGGDAPLRVLELLLNGKRSRHGHERPALAGLRPDDARCADIQGRFAKDLICELEGEPPPLRIQDDVELARLL